MPSPRHGAESSRSSVGQSLQTTLLVRLQANENDAWRRLDHLYGPVVFAWCRGAGLQADDADEVPPEVFRSVAGAIADFRHEKSGDSFRGWLWRIVQNKLRDFLRRQPRAAGGSTFQQQLQEIPLSDLGGEGSVAPSPSVEETDGVSRRALELVRSEFTERTWRAFWRVVIDGQSPADVAENWESVRERCTWPRAASCAAVAPSFGTWWIRRRV